MSKLDEPDLEPKWAKPPVGQMRVLDFIKAELAAGHPFPTAAQIAGQFGWNDSSAADALSRLKHHGHLIVTGRKQSGRGWRYTYGLANL